VYQAVDLFTAIVKAWRTGSRRLRILIAFGFALGIVGGSLFLIGDAGNFYEARMIRTGGTALVAVAFFVLSIVAVQQKSVDQEESAKKIEEVERRVHENPAEHQAAWDLARLKLEAYLARNLAQVKSIFWLTLLVMTAGFSLIVYGVVRVYDSPEAFKPSVVAACAGIIVNLIGASFLVVYRATMEQAKEYVTILERINAVGMAVQIVDGIEQTAGDELRAKTTADIAKQLLTLYVK